MNLLSIYILKILRKLYVNLGRGKFVKNPECDCDPDSVSKSIYELLIEDKPCMIARFGSSELLLIVNYLGVKYPETFRSYKKFILDGTPAWWWEKLKIHQIEFNAGFFPNDIQKIEKFCELMIQDIPLVDILGSWLAEESYFEKELLLAKKVWLLNLEPFWSENPWTKALEGKKVLVVHPFAETIEKQYKKRNLLFKNDLLPLFELKTIKAIQSFAGETTEFKDWFEALDYMKSEINKMDYDICLIGAGAYGFPLAAHVKHMGKKGFHLGGSLQLLFGIRGKRWETGSYKNLYNYPALTNKYWVRPAINERINNASKIENSCYW